MTTTALSKQIALCILFLLCISPPGAFAQAPSKEAQPAILGHAKLDATTAKVKVILEGHREPTEPNVFVVECTGAFGYSTIQSAIDAAVDGDIVIVLPADYPCSSTYGETIDFKGKAITVRSAEPTNPDIVEATVIDARQDGRVVSFTSGEGPNSILDGFTLQGGETNRGVGIWCCNGSSPTIRNCVIQENTASEYGAGVECLYASSPTLINCTIRDNFAGTFQGAGAGLCCFVDSCPTLIDCTIIDNSANITGGGIYCSSGCDATFINCRIMGNTANGNGGVSCYRSDALFVNCLISGNTSTNNGCAGFNCREGSPTLLNCTISYNIGNGGFLSTDTDFHMTQCIVQTNSFSVNGGNPVVTYSNIPNPEIGQHNIDMYPWFIDPSGPDLQLGTEDDDFRLQSQSACIDAGNPAFSPTHAHTDLDSNPRIMGCRVDMGAYEYVAGAPHSGDLDADGDLDYDDLTAFIAELLNSSGPTAICVADLNADDRADGVDIQMFADSLLAED